MKVPFLDLGRCVHELRGPIDEAHRRVMDSGRFLQGEELEAFERSFAGFCGAPYCVGVASGLDALALALAASGVGPGHEVVVPSHTCIATWLAVSAVGADPVPVEPDPATCNIDPAGVEAVVTERTRAIVPVHLYGQCADVDPLLELARRRGLQVIEDAAQAAGAGLRGRRAGSLGNAAAFSFYPSKNLGSFGDGGAVVTSDAELAERVRMLGSYGARQKHHHELRGRNSRLGELQAAFLRAKLARLPAWNRARRRLAEIYLDRLATRGDLSLPVTAADCEPVWHLFTVRVPGRDALRAELAARGIETAVHYPTPPHLTPAYAELRPRLPALPVAERISASVLSLPLHPHLTEAEVHAVCDAVLAGLDALP